MRARVRRRGAKCFFETFSFSFSFTVTAREKRRPSGRRFRFRRAAAPPLRRRLAVSPRPPVC
jgi:hypothetical protein